MKLGRLNHVGVATPSIEQSVAMYRERMGATTVHDAFDLPAQGVRVCFVDTPNSQIELIEPLGADSPIVEFRMTPGVASDAVETTYRELLTTVPPGITYVALHCNAPGDIETIVPPRAHWRTDEFRLFGSGTPRRWLAEAGVEAIGMRPLLDALRAAA